jgi:hypothetical protein
MDFKHTIGLIEESKEFKDFFKNNKHYYLVHIFSTKDNEDYGIWQIGYYSKETDKIVVFELQDELVFIHPPAEALKKEEYILPLNIDDVNISRDDAIQICEDIVKENYSKELVNKSIILLQNLPEHGQVWNITLVTLTLNVINIKINANGGNVIKHEKQNLMNWKS